MIFFTRLIAGSLLWFMAMVFAEDMSCCVSDFWLSNTQHCRTSVRHIERGGIGYKQGYTTVEGFFASPPGSLVLTPFLDLRAHVFDDGKIATNVGIGVRQISGCRVYGLNGYYDYRNTKKIHYNQVGFGLETLGKRWDFRVNTYLPMGKKITAPYDAAFVEFSGNNMIISQKYQFAMRGVNAELGIHCGKYRSVNFYAAIGTYYFKGADLGVRAWGGKVRVVCRLKQYLTLEISNSYDNVFHNRLQGQIGFTLPFGKGSSREQEDDYTGDDMRHVLFSRMVQPVERQEIIIVDHKKEHSAAIDPTTCQPYKFVFVDNTSHSAGTYESPYPTLALAQANSGVGDIIYVFPGDGTTKGMDAGITLQLNQKLWGSGINQFIQTAQGSFVIPAQSAALPQLTNTSLDTAGDGVTLSSGNQVRGVILTGALDKGIMGAQIESVDIAECIIQNNGERALEISFANQATVNLTDNVINENEGGSVMTFNGSATLLVSGNTIANTISVSDPPLVIVAGSSPLTATITNNTINNNTCSAIRCALNNTDSAQLTISGNTITNNAIGALGFDEGSAIVIDPSLSAAGNCILNITDNTFSGNGGYSLYCVNNGVFNDFQVNATGNTLTGNGKGGLVFANGCNSLTLTATDNIISNGGDHGISTDGDIIIDTVNMTISNNQITGNTDSANGIALGHSGTTLNFIAINNDLSSNASSGILMYPSYEIENVTATIANNTISNNQNLGSNASGGVDLEQFINLAGTLTNNTLSNNASSDLFIGSAETSPSVCLTMSGNSSNMGYTLSSGTGTFNLAPCNVDMVNSGIITPIGTITAVQSCPGATPCPP